MKCLIIIFLVLAILVFLFCISTKTEGYAYLQSLYDPTQGGFYSEYNEECLDNANRHCMLTDGTEGVCLLNGVCAASFLLGEDTTEKPYCTQPYSKEGCERWCMCTTLGKNPSKD